MSDEAKDEDSKRKPACPTQESECSLGCSEQSLKEFTQISDLSNFGF